MSIKLYDMIEAIDRPKAKYVVMPTEDTLTNAESQMAFTLPKSYRAFALLFGAGELANRFRIYAPLPKTYKFGGVIVYDLIQEHMRAASVLPLYHIKKKKTDFRLFCTDSHGATYLWNILEITKSSGLEYQIYQAIHTDEVYPVASTFDAFVKKCCLGKITTSNPPEDEAQEDWTFERFEIPPRK